MRLRSSLSLLVVLALMVPALAAAAGPKEKVDVCHIPPGNPGNAHTITVNGNALKAHLAHGDTEGECREERPGKVDDDDDSSDDKTSENRAPIARAGADRCVVYGPSYELDGTSSSDPDGDTLVFDWDVVFTPVGSGLDDGDLSPDDDDDDPMFTPNRLGTYRFELEVTDPDGASDTDVVDFDVYIDVELDKTQYDVVEDETVPVKITLSDEAPQDVKVSLSVDDDVVVFVLNSNDDERDKETEVTIDAGDDDVTVYLYGLEDSDTFDESTEITVSVGTDDCGVRHEDSADVDVEDDDEKVESFAATRSLQVFVREMVGFWIV